MGQIEQIDSGGEQGTLTQEMWLKGYDLQEQKIKDHITNYYMNLYDGEEIRGASINPGA